MPLFSLIPLFSAMAPFLLWPIELVLPYPHIIEEAPKTVIVFSLISSNVKTQEKIKIAIIAGIMFSISETVLYLFNIMLVGDLTTIFTRILLTVPLHIITMLIILASALYDKRLIIFGVIAAVLIHYLFNLAV